MKTCIAPKTIDAFIDALYDEYQRRNGAITFDAFLEVASENLRTTNDLFPASEEVAAVLVQIFSASGYHGIQYDPVDEDD